MGTNDLFLGPQCSIMVLIRPPQIGSLCGVWASDVPGPLEAFEILVGYETCHMIRQRCNSN